MARRKKGRSKASRKAAARKAAKTRAAKHAKRVRAAKKAARKRKRKGHRGRRRGGKRRAILRVRRHGRSVQAVCKAANRNRKRKNSGYRRGAGSSGVLQLNRKHKRRRSHGRKRRNELPVLGGLLKKLPGGDYLDAAVPYIGGGVIGVVGSNILPRYIPLGIVQSNKWVNIAVSAVGAAAAAWGSHKFLKSEKLALGAAVVGGFNVLAKLVAAFTGTDSSLRSLVGIGMSDLEGYAGLGDQLELSDNYGTGGGFQQDYLDYADGSIPTGADGAAGAGAVGADGISTSDDDMADMIEMQDFAEIR